MYGSTPSKLPILFILISQKKNQVTYDSANDRNFCSSLTRKVRYEVCHAQYRPTVLQYQVTRYIICGYSGNQY